MVSAGADADREDQLTVIDLSHVIRPGLQGWRYRPVEGVAVTTVRSMAEEGVQSLQLRFVEHVGTHLDTPAHIIADGTDVEGLPLERTVGTAVCLDVRRAQDAAITVADLQSGRPVIEPGDIVLLETGWSTLMGTRYYDDHHPYLAEPAAAWLVDRAVKAVGIDVLSVDRPNSLRPAGFRHGSLRCLLAAGVPALHGLTNLYKVRAMRFDLIAAPLVFRGADAGPVRALALIR